LANERVERRLMAILAADVAGYSRLVGADEEGTLARWKAHWRELIDPKIAEYRGRIVRITGDGLLVEFASVVSAVRCAVEVQRAMVERNAKVAQEKRIEFRMGINVGDIIIDGDDMWGDGVNVAARLEALAEPSGICISGRVQEDVDGKLDIAFEDTGQQQLKNIARPVRVYRVRLNGTAAKPAPALPDKPSIAVLAFNNMSGDPDQDYFAEGVVEEIITALSRTRWLFVIARNSSFTYKGRAVDVKQVGRDLGVRYVLEGGVRKMAQRVRITAQLIDASTGAHLWADHFDGGVEDIFDLQDQVAAKVVGAISPKLEHARLARLAVDLGTDDAIALCTGGYALAYLVDDADAGAAFINRALVINPNLTVAWYFSGWVKILLGEPEVAIDHFAHSMRLSPLDPVIFAARIGTACAHFFAGRYDEASSWAEQVLREKPKLPPAVHEEALCVAAASNALGGRLEDAQKVMARLREIDALRVSDLRDLTRFRRAGDVARYAEGLRKAGLPD
jgi:TolB-like protein